MVQLQNVGFKHESPMGLEVGLLASAGRGFSPPTCIVLLYCCLIHLTCPTWSIQCRLHSHKSLHINCSVDPTQPARPTRRPNSAQPPCAHISEHGITHRSAFAPHATWATSTTGAVTKGTPPPAAAHARGCSPQLSYHIHCSLAGDSSRHHTTS